MRASRRIGMLAISIRRLSCAKMSTLSFALNKTTPAGQFSPRLGTLALHRPDGRSPPAICTPALITATSQGVVPHLSHDHVALTKPIGWTQLHFESFLEQTPPVPTLQEGPTPLHEFLHYRTEQHILSLSVRDPHDGQVMPPNGNDFISALCVRGVRKMSPSMWRSYVLKCNPDVVTALSDTPFTSPPHSQKRSIKSLERSITWLADLLRPVDADFDCLSHPLNVLVHMVGGTDEHARQAFSERLTEPLYGKDAGHISPLKTLDEGVRGYVFDLVPLRASVLQQTEHNSTVHDVTRRIRSLIQVSLQPLPVLKLRVVHSALSPHEMLRLIRDIGVDLFDARWAQEAANLGVALDFRFPVPYSAVTQDLKCRAPPLSSDGKLELGHNLFSQDYAHDHTRLASTFIDAFTVSSSSSVQTSPVCPCAACSPTSPATHIVHSSVDIHTGLLDRPQTRQPPFTRAYIHHLLHTHEMSSHALLAMHNLTVMDAFLAGVREVLGRPDAVSAFDAEIERFSAAYSEAMSVIQQSRIDWAKVERERGKGRLLREKADSPR